MPRKVEKPLDKHLISFFSGDIATLKEFYAQIGHTAAVRLLVHNHCNKLRERVNRQGAANVRPNLELDLDISDLVGDGAGGD